jgi:hypothetical protein
MFPVCIKSYIYNEFSLLYQHLSHMMIKHAALRSKSKDWLAQNQNNVSEWSDMSTRGLLFQ